MRTKQVAGILLAISLVMTAWLIVGSFVTYAPTVSASRMQNIYISRIVNFGLSIGTLNLAALVSLVIGVKSGK